MSLTGPDILRLACGDASTSEASPRRGDRAFKEFDILRTTWEAIQQLGVESPREESVASVQEDARAVGTRDALGPDPQVLRAIRAEARTMSELMTIASRVPGSSPSAHAVETVLEKAREASEGAAGEVSVSRSYGDKLASLRAVIYDGEVPAKGTPAYAEYQMLKQALDALERLPAASPRAETILSVESAAAALHTAETEKAAALMRAALGEEGISDEAKPEVEALRSTLDATARASRPSPSEAAVSAVLAEAKRRRRVPVGMLPGEVDRPATRPVATASRFSWQRWAGVAVVLLASTFALLVMRPWSTSVEGEQLSATQQPQEGDLAGEETTAGMEEVQPGERAETQSQPDLARSDAPSGPQVAAANESSSVSAVPGEPVPSEREDALSEGPSPAPSEEEAPSDVGEVAARVDDANTTRQGAPREDVSWEASEDVRALSLRLQELREQNEGLEWGEPAVALGVENDARRSEQPVGAGENSGVVRVRARVNPEASLAE